MFLAAYVRFGLITLLGLTALVYWVGLSGDYLFDDRANILDNESFKFSTLTWDAMRQILASGDAGTFKRPISMASFALNIAATGFDPFFLKLTNLAIHLINGVLVFFFASRVAASFNRLSPTEFQVEPRVVGILASGLWLLHPINLTSILYIVQRMNSLAALFTLCAIIAFVVGRARIVDGTKRGWILCTVGVLVPTMFALFSKENAVLIPVFMFVLEFTLFRLRTTLTRDRRLLLYYFGAIIGIPLLGLLGVMTLRPDIIFGGYAFRDFTMTERLMTQCRVVTFYLQLILLPSNSALGLYHDDISISRALLNPPTTLFAMAFLIVLFYAAVRSASSQPRLSFAILWFLGGHLLESTFIPLEMVHEHRNYIPSIGILFGVAHYLTYQWKGLLRGVVPVAALVLVALLSLVTHERAYAWRNLIAQAETEAANHPESGRANLQIGRVYAMLMDSDHEPAYFQKAVDHFWKTAKTDGLPGYVGLLRVHYLAGREPDQKIIEKVIQSVATGKQAPAIPTLVQNMSTCNLFEYCKLPDKDMLRVFHALRDNPEATQVAKSIVAMVEAQYLYDKVGDRVAATRLLEELVATDPKNLNAVRNLVRVYRLAGRVELARQRLVDGRRNDRYGAMTREFDAEAKLLAQTANIEIKVPNTAMER